MPRTGRKHSVTGIYHVMLRGINRQDVFEEPEDYFFGGGNGIIFTWQRLAAHRVS